MKKQTIRTRLTASLAAAALAAGTLAAMPTTMTADAAGLTGKDARGITSQMTIGWNLGNTLDCSGVKAGANATPATYATAWGNPVPTGELVQAVKDAGFNTIRIPTTWYQHITWDDSSQMYLVNDQWMDFVKQTVDYAYERDMFIILNIHHEDFINVTQFTDQTYADASKKMTDIWTQVAETFKDYDQHLIFEGMNEPRQTKNPSVGEWGDGTGDGGYTTSYINKLNAVFVDTVRSNGSAANKERLLMLPGYCASNSATAIRNIEIPNGAGNVALSVHAYTPYYFTMATDDKANHSFPGASGWGADYEGELSNMFSYLGQIQNEKNAPVIIGEFSASNFGNTEDRCRWATDYLTKAKAQGIPCVLWDNNAPANNGGEAHGYLYRANNTWYPDSAPVIRSMMAVYGITPNLPDYVEVTEPAFNWDDIQIGDDWVELFRDDEGYAMKTWKNRAVRGYNKYVNDGYDLALIYKSADQPELVLQDIDTADSWNRIASSDVSETPFVKIFTWEDIAAACANVEDMDNLYISATNSDLTAYGLYAIPRAKAAPAKGDVDADGTVAVVDVVALQRYLLMVGTLNDAAQADMNEDGVVDVFDLALLKRAVLK